MGTLENSRTIKYIKTSLIDGFTSSTSEINELVINDSLKIYHNSNPSTTGYNGYLGLYDKTAKNYKTINCDNSNLIFNGNNIITSSNLLSVLNSIVYEGSNTLTGYSTLNAITASNIAVLGKSSTDHGYLNFGTTQGNDGFGIRYNKTESNLQMKNTNSDTWNNLINNKKSIKVYDDSNVSGSNFTVAIFSEEILLLKVSDLSIGTYNFVIPTDSTFKTNGRKLEIIYDSGTSTDIIVKFDFGVDTLYCGSGKARYLTLKRSGQSASCVFIEESLNRWQILNTGGDVS
jgi:hypothetical protein